MPIQGFTPMRTTATIMNIMAKSIMFMGSPKSLATPLAPCLTLCVGYSTSIRSAGIPENIPPVHWGSSPVASRWLRMSADIPAYCAISP